MMRFIRIAAYALLVMVICGCGRLSNQWPWEGEGIVTGRAAVGGAPVEGALVFVVGEPDNFLTTGQSGGFFLTTPAGEDRHLVVMWGTNRGLRKRFALAGEGELELGDLELKALGMLEGRVNLPFPQEAEVRVEGTPFVARPDWAGYYQIMVPEGKWNLVITAPGRQEARIENVEIGSGDTKDPGTASPQPDPDYTCVGTEIRVERFSQGGSGAVDILFLVDNSKSMVGEQKALAYTFNKFASILEEGSVDYRIAVVTTGMRSDGCPSCSGQVTGSCMNLTGENGRFQDRIGRNQCTEDDPCYLFDQSDPACRVVTTQNLYCFYNQSDESGTVFVGINGCGYERGLAAMRTALRSDMLDTYNAGFLRSAARLAIILISDENDCGEVGDVYELSVDGGNVCFYAAKGVGPEGNTSNPMDPQMRPYELTPVEDYYQFLLGLKDGSKSMVKFAAIVGVKDKNNPSSTTIEYEWNEQKWEIQDACTTAGCTGDYCFAEPGTRYIEMAQMTGGIVESICQLDFSDPMLRISGASTGYVRIFPLQAVPVSPDVIEVFVNKSKQTLGWSWDPAKQAVVFEEASAPPPYSLVEITYETACQ